MFNICFNKTDRDYVRFFWIKDNNPDMELIEYRSCVHVFGNSPTLTIATYGLCECAETMEEMCCADVREFIKKNFYVDDGLASIGKRYDSMNTEGVSFKREMAFAQTYF